MLAHGDKDPPEVHHALAVQLQRIDGRSPAWRDADHESRVRAPGEVVVPALRPRMEERGRLTRQGIARLGARVLEVVAALAGKRQIIQRRRSAATSRRYMLH